MIAMIWFTMVLIACSLVQCDISYCVRGMSLKMTKRHCCTTTLVATLHNYSAAIS